MHILFVHKNFPAQFGHLAIALIRHFGHRCTFISELPDAHIEGIERIQYTVEGGATPQTHYCSRTFENAIWHATGICQALGARPDIQPDLIVGHSGLGPTLFLREMYSCPIIDYFEFFYHSWNSDLDFRPNKQVPLINRMRSRARNAMFLLDLEFCTAGYSPTQWQRQQLPEAYRDKVRVLFDGMDTTFWKPIEKPTRTLGQKTIPENMRIVTYVSRGLELQRGFDIFMDVARRLCQLRNDVVFVVVGQEKCYYGSDDYLTGGKTLKEWILEQHEHDLSRFLFLGPIPPENLVEVFSLSDLHIYLTVPFVLSWSLLNALACETTVLASNTPPVQEVLDHEQNGLLVDFFDIDGFVEQAMKVLDSPADYRKLGLAGRQLVLDRYSLDVCLPQFAKFFEEIGKATKQG